MKMLRIPLILVFTSLVSFAQLSPTIYNLEKTKLSKTGSLLPKGNNIIDILLVDDTLWLATTRGLSKTTDDGRSWTNYYNSPDFGTESIVSVGYSEGTIWAGTAHSEEINSTDVPVGTGLRYSINNGETWTTIPQSVDNSGDSIIIYGNNNIRALPVTIPQQNLYYDLAYTPGKIWTVSWAGGLRNSTNKGNTWNRVVLPPDNLNKITPEDSLNFSLQPVAGRFGPEAHLNHMGFSVIATNDTTIYMGSAGGINKSTDGGISWIKFNHQNQLSPISGNFATALGYDEVRSSIWAATWRAEDNDEYYGVSTSSNGGVKWHTYLYGQRSHNFGFKYYLNNQNQPDSDVLTATDNGIFRSSNSELIWNTPYNITDNQKMISIFKSDFNAVSIKSLQDSAIVWLGSAGDGLAKMIEKNGAWSGDWLIYLASEPLKSNTETYAFPNPFSPDDEFVRIKYNTGSGYVTIRVFDFGMNLVRTIIQNAQRSANTDQIEYWNGKDDNGNAVPNGVYFYRIDIDGSEPIYNKIMVLM